MVPLRCHIPVDFEFQLEYLQPNSAFSVDPMSGESARITLSTVDIVGSCFLSTHVRYNCMFVGPVHFLGFFI